MSTTGTGLIGLLLFVQLFYARGVALNCYECMSIDIMQKDITMLSNVAPLYDTVVEVAYNNTPPPQCDNAALVTCPEGQRCLTTKVILWGSYLGINGKLDIHLSLCYDPNARGFKNLPEDGCGSVDDIVSNFKKMGSTFDGVFNRADGSSCTCGENGCNLLSKLCGDRSMPVCDCTTVPGISAFLMGAVFIMSLA